MKIAKNKIGKHLLAYALTLLSLMVIACNTPADEGNDSTSNNASLKVQTVEVVHPTKRSFISEVHIVGTAMPNQKVMVHAMEGGYVSNIAKDIGDYVVAGQVIAELHSQSLDKISTAKELILSAIKYSKQKTTKPKLIKKIIK